MMPDDDTQVTPHVPLVTPSNLLILGEAVGNHGIEVGDGVEVHHVHAHGADDLGSTVEVVEERVRFGDLHVVVHREVAGSRLPRAMGRLVVAEQRKRDVDVTIYEVDAIVGDEVGDVAASFDDPTLSFEHDGVVVVPLTGKHPPFIEARRLVAGAVAEMPLANDARHVSRTLERLGERPQRVVERSVEGRHPVHVVVGARQDRRTARCADRVRAEGCVHAHAAIGNPIEVGSSVDTTAIRRDRVGGVVVRHDEEEVGTSTFGHGRVLRCGVVPR